LTWSILEDAAKHSHTYTPEVGTIALDALDARNLLAGMRLPHPGKASTIIVCWILALASCSVTSEQRQLAPANTQHRLRRSYRNSTVWPRLSTKYRSKYRRKEVASLILCTKTVGILNGLEELGQEKIKLQKSSLLHPEPIKLTVEMTYELALIMMLTQS
jgi:hypothetical protein